MLTLGISACMAIILFRPDVYVASALEGVKLWALVVLPSLLPFFFFTSLLAKIGATERMARTLKKPCEQIFGTSGYAAYAFLMSILSGYPVGAKIIGDLGENGLIDETDATKMSAFCSTSGPLFIVGSVSVGMFGSVAAGKLLFLAHTLSALITGVIFRFYRQTKKRRLRRTKTLRKPFARVFRLQRRKPKTITCFTIAFIRRSFHWRRWAGSSAFFTSSQIFFRTSISFIRFGKRCVLSQKTKPSPRLFLMV